PAAAGRLRIARALHALSTRGGPLVSAIGRRPSLDTLVPGTTLYLDAGALAPEAALALEALLDDGAVWVIAGREPGARLALPLAVRLGAVAIEVPPLSARTSELPALAQAVVERLATRAGRSA